MLSIGTCLGQDANMTAGYGVLNASADLGSINTFSTAIQSADLLSTLNNSGILIFGNSSYEIFAPSDAAFANFTGLGALLANQTDLRRVLDYHIAWSRDPIDINSTKSLQTLEGENLTIANSNGLTVNGARVLQFKSYDNGTIYVIDKVLVPNRKTGSAGMGVVEASSSLGDAKKFTSSLQSAGFVDRLNGQGVLGITALAEGPFTIFAPSDAAFSSLPSSVNNLINSDPANLRTLLSYHMVSKSDVTGGGKLFNRTGAMSIKTLEGSSLVVDTAAGQVNSAKVIRAKRYENGIIYEIDQVLVPVRLSLGAGPISP